MFWGLLPSQLSFHNLPSYLRIGAAIISAILRKGLKARGWVAYQEGKTITNSSLSPKFSEN